MSLCACQVRRVVAAHGTTRNMSDMRESDTPRNTNPARLGYDLHTHSTCSDGTDEPAEIARLAAAAGLAGFALTDHDTTVGWQSARSTAAELNIEFLPGMEITTRCAGRSTHLLAYGFDPENDGLVFELERVRASRLGRAREMVQRLSVDFDIVWDAVHEGDDTRTVGRPHIADALVRSGYFSSRDAAFATALSSHSKYYVHTYAIDTAHAIELVNAAGGVTVLAHPAASRNKNVIASTSLEELVEAGLWGIELAHPENVADRIPALQGFAAAHGLRVTGSSDYHGTGKVNALGQCVTSAEVWQELRAAVALAG